MHVHLPTMQVHLLTMNVHLPTLQVLSVLLRGERMLSLQDSAQTASGKATEHCQFDGTCVQPCVQTG